MNFKLKNFSCVGGARHDPVRISQIGLILPKYIANIYSSVGKESACSVGDPGSIPGLGRSAGEGIGYPLQYSWASLVARLVKNPPAMWETWVQSLGWEDPLEKGKATHSRILAWRIPWGHKELDTTGQLSLSITQVHSQQLHKDENYGNF